MELSSKYVPNPIQTNDVILPSTLVMLVERLAKHTHDLWAEQRFRDGWIYGKRRDDKKREHPCLVPYKDLPESEKDYDRVAVTGTIKAILKLGYRIDHEDATP